MTRAGYWIALAAIGAAVAWYQHAPKPMPERAAYLCTPFARTVALGTGLLSSLRYEALPFGAAWIGTPRRECERFLLRWAADVRN